MSDFTPPGPTHKPNFTNAERRKVVVKHEAFRGLAGLEQFNPLLIVFRAKRGRHQCLRLTARKHARSMRPRQHARLDPDIAHFIERAPIWTPPLLQHLVAEDALFQGLENLASLLQLLWESLFDLRLDG